MATPKARIRLPAGGDSSKAMTVTAGVQPDARSQKNELPAKEWCINDDVLNVSDSASFTVDNDDGRNANKFFLGQRVEIDLSDADVAGGDWIRSFTGRVIRIESASDLSGGSVILVSCMDLGWHLTSCMGQPLLSLKGMKLSTLIAKLIDSTWGFASTSAGPNVNLGNALNRSLKQGRLGASLQFIPPLQLQYIPIQVEPGQTPWQILQTYAQRIGLLLNVGAKGDLILFQPQYNQQSPYTCVHYHGSKDGARNQNNVERRPTLTQSIDGIYSEVQCWSTVVKPVIVQESQISQDPNAQYTHSTYKPSSNPLPFNRRHVFSDGEAINKTMRDMRALWKYQIDQFNSWEYSVDIDRHSSNGVFYSSDTMQSVNDSINGVNSPLYIQSVRRSVTIKDGTQAHLTLRKPYLLNPALQAQTGTIPNPPPVVK